MNSFPEGTVAIKTEKCDSNYGLSSCSSKVREPSPIILNSFSVPGAILPDAFTRFDYTIGSKDAKISPLTRENQSHLTSSNNIAPLELTNHTSSSANIQSSEAYLRNEAASYASVIQSSSTSSESSPNVLTKPPYTYPALITMAIKNSKEQQLTLREIYDYLRGNFPYFATTKKKGWQNSIRHNLSLNKCFLKVARPDGCSKKGCLWKLDPDYEDMYEDGNYCRRRRMRGNIKKNPSMGKGYYPASLTLNASPFLSSTYASVPPNTCVTSWPLSHVQQHRTSGQCYPTCQTLPSAQSLHASYAHMQSAQQQVCSSSPPESPLQLTGHLAGGYSTHSFTTGPNTAFPGHYPSTCRRQSPINPRLHTLHYQPY